MERNIFRVFNSNIQSFNGHCKVFQEAWTLEKQIKRRQTDEYCIRNLLNSAKQSGNTLYLIREITNVADDFLNISGYMLAKIYEENNYKQI